jgi:hypothetical protein
MKSASVIAVMIMVAVLLVLAACSKAPVTTRSKAYVSFPERIDTGCRDGKARMFDQCGDQSVLFNTALERAKVEGKVLLVEFGAEWCIWCHVFEAHVNGERDRFRYTYGSPHEPEARYTENFEEGAGSDADAADSLREFVAANFVVVHIDAEHAPNGFAVLESTGADVHYAGGVPFVFTVDERGRFAGTFNHDAVEKRRDTPTDWYRGYDRKGLMTQLSAMRDMARAPLESAAASSSP